MREQVHPLSIHQGNSLTQNKAYLDNKSTHGPTPRWRCPKPAHQVSSAALQRAYIYIYISLRDSTHRWETCTQSMRYLCRVQTDSDELNWNALRCLFQFLPTELRPPTNLPHFLAHCLPDYHRHPSRIDVPVPDGDRCSVGGCYCINYEDCMWKQIYS